MQAIFKYNGKLIQCMNLQKKLKKMKLFLEDIELIWEGEISQADLEKKFNDLNNIQKTTEVNYNYRYRIYSNTTPPKFIKETDIKPKKDNSIKILILNEDEFIFYY